MSHMSDSSAHILLASRHRYRRDAKGRPRGQPQASNSDKQHFPSMPRRPPSFAHVNSPRTGVNATPLAVAGEPSPLPRHPARHSGDHFHAAKNEGKEAGRQTEGKQQGRVSLLQNSRTSCQSCSLPNRGGRAPRSRIFIIPRLLRLLKL